MSELSRFNFNSNETDSLKLFMDNKTKLTPRECGILLGYAIMNNMERLTSVILEHPDVEINIPTSDPTIPTGMRMYNPFICSAKKKNIKIMKSLIKLGANPNVTDVETGSTALHYAVLLHDKEMVGYLVDTNKLEMNVMNVNGQTPFHIAVVKGYDQLVKIMLDKGFPVDTPTSGGDTPIIQCSHNFNDRVFDLLLARGADIHQVTQTGDTLIHNLVYGFNVKTQKHAQDDYGSPYNKYNPKNVLSLISKKFNSKKEFNNFMNKVNNKGETPLNVALQRSFDGLFALLLDYGSDPMIVDYGGSSPFLFVIKSNAFLTLKSFLNVVNKDVLKKTLNTLTIDGCLPLQYAIDNYINLKAQTNVAGLDNTYSIPYCMAIIEECIHYGTNLKIIQSSGMTLEDYIVIKQVSQLLPYVNEKYTPSPTEPDELKALRPIKRAELELQKTRKPAQSKSRSPKSNVSMKPYDPILMENHTIDEWLSDDPDNIIFIFNGKQWCMKRSYFIQDLISPYNVLQDCVKGKSGKYNTLGEKYIHLQMVGIPDSGILPLHELAFFSNPKSIQRIYTLHASKNRISTVHEMEMTMTTIRNKELFEASIDLHSGPVSGVVERKYISHMVDYTYKWDVRVNYYLRSGKSDEDFAKDALHLQYYTDYADTPIHAIKLIKDKISAFDEIFSKFALISHKPITVYRGVQNSKTDKPFEGLQPAYISTSTDINVALGFSNDNCCIYKFTILPGVPFISMYRHSRFQEEFEILLPRGLTVDITDTSEIKGVKQYECEVRLSSPDQFKHMLHKCYMHPILTVDKPFHFTDIVNEAQAKKYLANQTRSREKTLRKTRSLGLSRSKDKRTTKRNMNSKHSK